SSVFATPEPRLTPPPSESCRNSVTAPVALASLLPPTVTAPGGVSLFIPQTVPRPILHQLPPLLEQVAAPVCRLNAIADSVRECLVYDRVHGCPSMSYAETSFLRIGTTSPSTSRPAQKSDHICIISRRRSNRVVRLYERSTALGMACANAISATSRSKPVRSAAHVSKRCAKAMRGYTIVLQAL